MNTTDIIHDYSFTYSSMSLRNSFKQIGTVRCGNASAAQLGVTAQRKPELLPLRLVGVSAILQIQSYLYHFVGLEK